MITRVPWLHVAGNHDAAMISAMAEAGAYYHGRGWYRIFGPDFTVRSLLTEAGKSFEPGVPPANLLTISRTEARVLRMTGWSR